MITTIDEAGRPLDFVSSGLTPDQHREMASWPDGLRLFEHLRDLPSPLRLRDFSEHVRSLGFSADLLSFKTFVGTPMRHRSQHVGNFYLSGKEDEREFTDADEEILVLFAAQAATAIANARTHRDVERARADLETLVETSPWAWRSSMPGPALRCRSTGRRHGLWRVCALRANRRSIC